MIDKKKLNEHIDIWVEGLYAGIALSNDKLKAMDIRIDVPTKKSIIKKYNLEKK